MCYLKCHKSINAEIAYSIHHLHYNSLLYCCLPVSVDFRSDRSMLLFIANFLLLSWMKLSGIFLPSLNYSFFFYNRGFVFRFYTCCRWACILYYYLSFHLLVCDTSSISTRFSLRHCSCLSVYKLVVQCPIVCAISWQCSLLFFIIMSGTSSLIYYFFPCLVSIRISLTPLERKLHLLCHTSHFHSHFFIVSAIKTTCTARSISGHSRVCRNAI